jgi:hypothetical protein
MQSLKYPSECGYVGDRGTNEMNDKTSDICSMLGAFNLRPDYDLGTFKPAFDAFCDHLKQTGYLHSHRLWRRAYHEGYDTRFPDAGIVIEMCFHHYQASLDAWDYVEDRSEPLRSLHIAMNKQVTETYFVLLHEVESITLETGQE